MLIAASLVPPFSIVVLVNWVVGLESVVATVYLSLVLL